MRVQNKRNVQPFDKVFSWAQYLHGVCLGTPIAYKIESPIARMSKQFSVETFADGEIRTYYFDSTMPNDILYQEWGRCKDETNRLLDLHVGHRVNAHGRERE